MAAAVDALRLKEQIPAEYQDAYYQLVLYPIDACSNVYEMYYAVAKNKELAARYDLKANYFADKVKECFERNAYLDHKYNNEIAGGKWKHMMDQMRIGYKTWQTEKKI